MLNLDVPAKLKDRNISEDVANNVIYTCLGGSHISGTNDETSDIDLRSITSLTQSYYTGVNKFEHTKLTYNDVGFNQYGDLDIELFSLYHFLRELYHGEIIPFEMIHVEAKHRLEIPEILSSVFAHKDRFVTKKVLTRYMRFVHKYHQKASLKGVSKVNRTDRVNRVTMYGYETKYAMNVIKVCEMIQEILSGKAVNLYRNNKDFLLSVKSGYYTQDQYIAVAEDLIKECNEKIEDSSDIAPYVDPNFMNPLMHGILSKFR